MVIAVGAGMKDVARAAGGLRWLLVSAVVFAGAFAGLRLPLGSFIVQATGEGGRHWLINAGSRLGHSVDAQTGSLPYVGGHLQVGRALRPLGGRLSLALGAFGRWDLRRQQITSVERDSCFAFCSGTTTETFEAGGESFGLTVSAEFRDSWRPERRLLPRRDVYRNQGAGPVSRRPSSNGNPGRVSSGQARVT